MYLLLPKGYRKNASSSQISHETFLAHRAQCAELQRDELDLVILSHIDAHGLPSDLPKAALYARYQQACTGARIQAVGHSKFYDTRHFLLPHISVSTLSNKLCFVCQQNNLAIQKAVCLSDDDKSARIQVGLSDDEKSARIQVAQTHLDRAKTER